MKKIAYVALGVLLLGGAAWQVQPVAQSESLSQSLSWREFVAQCEREDAAIKAAFAKNDEPGRRLKSGEIDFGEAQALKRTGGKRSESMADYTVSGGGSTGVNGIYVETGMSGGKPYYSNGYANLLWVDSKWKFLQAIGDTNFYESSAGGDTPPSTGWTPIFGPAPAPTVTLEAGAPADTTSPIFASASVATNGNSIAVVLTETDSAPVLPSTGVTGFTVLVGGVSRTISSATASGTTVALNLTSPVYNGETVTVSYTPGNATDSVTNAMASFAMQSVTNSSTLKPSRRPIALVNGQLKEISDSEVVALGVLPSVPPDVLAVTQNGV